MTGTLRTVVALTSRRSIESRRSFSLRSGPGGPSVGLETRLYGPPNIWLEDVRLRFRKGVPTIEGFEIPAATEEVRPKWLPALRARAQDWKPVALDPRTHEFFCSGRPVFGAKYAQTSVAGTVRVMGAEMVGLSSPDLALPVYSPSRSAWLGRMGGLNYSPPDNDEVSLALEEVWRDFPGSVVVDGTDDWFAPIEVRPELFVARFDLCPLALWHTGASGKSTSGLVLSELEFELLDRRYLADVGHRLAAVASERSSESPSRCGCWDGRAFRIHRQA